MFIAILGILYILLVCFPAFMFAYESNDLKDLGCEGFLLVILGFPGAVLGYIVRSIRETNQKEKAQQNLMQAAEEKKERDRIAEQELNTCISKYTNSHLLPQIISFITKHGTPNSVHIYTTGISVYHTGGRSDYQFFTNGINNLPRKSDKPYEPNEAYALGCAIRQKLGNSFTITGNKFGDDSAFLSRPLQDF